MNRVGRIVGSAAAFLLIASSAWAAKEHLPLGWQKDDASLIKHALQMTSVKKAIAKCEGRGYQRCPESDAVVRSQSLSGTAVFVAFEKPGLTLPPGQLGAPAVVVATLPDGFGDKKTTVAGMMIVADLEAQRFRSGDEYADLAATDGSFEIGGDMGTLEASAVEKTMAFLACAGWGALGCSVQAILTTPPVPPAVVVRAVVCSTIVSIGCLAQIVF